MPDEFIFVLVFDWGLKPSIHYETKQNFYLDIYPTSFQQPPTIVVDNIPAYNEVIKPCSDTSYFKIVPEEVSSLTRTILK